MAFELSRCWSAHTTTLRDTGHSEIIEAAMAATATGESRF
jgi:hypothetical protein